MSKLLLIMAFLLSAPAALAGPLNTINYYKVPNNTGKDATDLTVQVGKAVSGAGLPAGANQVSSFNFKNAGVDLPAFRTIHFTNGTVLNGNSDQVGWNVAGPPDVLTEFEWSAVVDGKEQNIGGGLGDDVDRVSLSNSNGTTTIALASASGAAYSGLAVFDDVSPQFFTVADSLNHLASGEPVPLLAPTSGVLSATPLDLATFRAEPGSYYGIVYTVDGVQEAFTQMAVPEPGTWALLLTGFAAAAAVGLRQRQNLRRSLA
jgi:hypothetical protein